MHCRLRVAAIDAAYLVHSRGLVRLHEQASVGVVEGPQLRHDRTDRTGNAETRVGECRDVFEQRKPSVQHDLETTPVGHHVAEHEQESGAQQKAVQLESGLRGCLETNSGKKDS